MVNQQANMAAALGGTDSSYLRMSSLNGLENFHTLNGSGQFHNTSFRSFPPSGLLGRLNTPAGMGMRGLSSSGMTQLSHARSSSGSTVDQADSQQVMHPGNHNGGVLQGMPMTLELDQLQHIKGVTHARELSTAIDNRAIFPICSGLLDAKTNIGSSSNPLLGVANTTLMLEQNPRAVQGGEVFGNQSPVSLASLNSELSSPLLDHRRLNENWSTAAQSSGIHSNSFQLNDCFKQTTQSTMHQSNVRDDMSKRALQMGSNLHDVSSATSVSTELQDRRSDMQCGASLTSSNAGKINNHAGPQGWVDHNEDSSYRSNVMCSTMNSMIPVQGAVGPFVQSSEPKNFHPDMDFNSIGQSHLFDPSHTKHDEVNKSHVETSLKLKQGLRDQRKPQESYISSSFGSLEDIVTAMVKRVI